MAERHTTIRDGRRLIWQTKRLWKLADHLVPFDLDVSSVKELDQDCWFGKDVSPTLRKVAYHCRKINNASFDFPIILNADGSLMDGGHRLCRALLEGKKTLKAVRFDETPEPDEIIDLQENKEGDRKPPRI